MCYESRKLGSMNIFTNSSFSLLFQILSAKSIRMNTQLSEVLSNFFNFILPLICLQFFDRNFYLCELKIYRSNYLKAVIIMHFIYQNANIAVENNFNIWEVAFVFSVI